MIDRNAYPSVYKPDNSIDPFEFGRACFVAWSDPETPLPDCGVSEAADKFNPWGRESREWESFMEGWMHELELEFRTLTGN